MIILLYLNVVMIINDVDYKLPISNYVDVESIKKQIVIGHTFNHDMQHISGWLHRYNGDYKKTAAYSISSSGLIYQHFEPKLQSNYFNSIDLNKSSIVILLENDGWLIKDEIKNEFITWNGYIYNKPNEVVNKKWRCHEYWAPYSDEQFNSTVYLVKLLCDEFFISPVALNHNTKVDSLLESVGVLYHSNLNNYNTDLNPSWDCSKFKEKISIV